MKSFIGPVYLPSNVLDPPSTFNLESASEMGDPVTKMYNTACEVTLFDMSLNHRVRINLHLTALILTSLAGLRG